MEKDPILTKIARYGAEGVKGSFTFYLSLTPGSTLTTRSKSVEPVVRPGTLVEPGVRPSTLVEPGVRPSTLVEPGVGFSCLFRSDFVVCHHFVLLSK